MVAHIGVKKPLKSGAFFGFLVETARIEPDAGPLISNTQIHNSTENKDSPKPDATEDHTRPQTRGHFVDTFGKLPKFVSKDRMMSSVSLSLFFLAALVALPSIADAKRLYRWVDDNGVTHFSDEEPDSGAHRVFPSGMSVIPMRDNIRAQQNIERIKRPVMQPSSAPKAVPQPSASTSRDWDIDEKEREKERRQKACQSYEDRIDWIDSRLRAGGYSVGQGNRLRAERRELSSTRAWQCLRNN